MQTIKITARRTTITRNGETEEVNADWKAVWKHVRKMVKLRQVRRKN